MIQDVITYIFIAIAVANVIYGMYKLLFSKNKKTICGTCNEGCDHVKQNMIKKKRSILQENTSNSFYLSR